MPDFDLSLHKFAGLIEKEIRKRRLVLFLGAGFSYPAGVLTFERLRIDFKKAVLEVLRKHPRISREVYDASTRVFDDADLMFEHVLEHFHGVYGPDALDWLQILSGGIPHVRHRLIALLAKKGYITYLITPNYDRLFERIFAEYDVPFSLFCPTDGYYERHKDGDKRVLILKPHGTFTPKHEDVSHLITTTGQIGIRPHILTEQIIQAIVKNRSILFAGYRDKDIDLFPAFSMCADQMKYLFWTAYKEDDPPSADSSDSVGRLLQKLEERGFCLRGDGTSDIITELFLRIAGDSPSDINGVKSVDTTDEKERRETSGQPDLQFLASEQHHGKALLSLGHLLQQYGERRAARLLFEYLIDVDLLGNNTRLRAACWRGLCHALHSVDGINPSESLRKVRKSIQLLVLDPSAQCADELIDALARLGYEHLCQIKALRIKARNPLHFLIGLMLIPYHLIAAELAFRKASKAARILKDPYIRSKKQFLLRWLVPHYRVDLFDSFLKTITTRRSLKLVVLKRWYRYVAGKYAELRSLRNEEQAFIFEKQMEARANAIIWDPTLIFDEKIFSRQEPADYYWMKENEAKLFSGCITQLERTEIIRQLEDAENDLWNRAYDDLTLANCKAYRALMQSYFGEKLSSARDLLNDAEKIFERSSSLAGRRRITFFRNLLDLNGTRR